MAEQQFNSKVALVTGGASGIGRACAQLFAREGALVIVSDVALEGGQQTVRLIEEDGGEASFVEAFVSKAVHRPLLEFGMGFSSAGTPAEPQIIHAM